MSTAVNSTAADGTWSNRVGFYGVHLFVLAYLGVLAGGFIVQFGGNEFPCPLCMLQRMAMMLACVGPVFIIAKSRRGDVAVSDYALGLGLAILSSLTGMAMSGRQVLLHIVPGDEGYGDPVLGLHVYTWAFITFAIVILYSAVCLIFAARTTPRRVRYGWFSRLVVWAFLAVVVANALTVFAEEGFHWFLPDDPTRYELFFDLGILKD